MTNKEAIETINIAIAEVEWNYPMEYAIAFEMAIDALEKQVQKKPIKTKIATLNKVIQIQKQMFLLLLKLYTAQRSHSKKSSRTILEVTKLLSVSN